MKCEKILEISTELINKLRLFIWLMMRMWQGKNERFGVGKKKSWVQSFDILNSYIFCFVGIQLNPRKHRKNVFRLMFGIQKKDMKWKWKHESLIELNSCSRIWKMFYSVKWILTHYRSTDFEGNQKWLNAINETKNMLLLLLQILSLYLELVSPSSEYFYSLISIIFLLWRTSWLVKKREW